MEIVVFGSDLSESALNLSVKSLIIIPINKGFFLYIDSGTREYFSETDIEVFRVLGELLGRAIESVMRDEEVGEGITGISGEIKKIREMVLKYSLEDEPVININKKYLKGKEIGSGFWDVILKHQWPGNMRELITVLKRAGISTNF